jgi:hypothetical protein
VSVELLRQGAAVAAAKKRRKPLAFGAGVGTASINNITRPSSPNELERVRRCRGRWTEGGGHHTSDMPGNAGIATSCLPLVCRPRCRVVLLSASLQCALVHNIISMKKRKRKSERKNAPAWWSARREPAEVTARPRTRKGHHKMPV